LVGGPGWDNPFGGLAGNLSDSLVVSVIVENGERKSLGCGGHEQVRN
jgi:hypothetical protein